MSKKTTLVARRAWNVLRLALLWARKGGAFKRGLIMELRLLPNYIKGLRCVNPRSSIHYNEKEFSFDETPLFQFKMHRPASIRFLHLPCLKPKVDFDFDSDYQREESCNEDEIVQVEDEEDIDIKAEEFIAKFHKQMKLQRQISYLEYNVIPNTGPS